MQDRLMWCFPKQRVTYLLACLESLKLSLLVISQILQLAELMSSSHGSMDLIGLESLSSDDAIGQQKAETQNMIIVRYWSVKRLDRMWDMVEQEALAAANDPTSQRINYGYATTAMKPPGAATKGSDMTKIHGQTFGNIDVGLSDIERSPKDMVQLSECAMNQLLSLWVPSLRHLGIQAAEKSVHYADGSIPRHGFASSESDNESQDRDDDTRVYYLEGSTTDWRKPHSQQARYEAAQMRKQYAGYQAHVEDFPETDDIPGEAKPRPTPPNAEELKSVSPQPATAPHGNGGRIHSNSFTTGYPPHPPTQYPDAKPTVRHSDSFPLPNQTVPRPQQTSHPPPVSPSFAYHYAQQPYRQSSNQEYYRSTPRSIPVNPNRPNPHPRPPTSSSSSSPRGTPSSPSEPTWNRPQGYNASMPPPRHPPGHPPGYSLSTSSPESTFRTSPPRSAQRSPTQSRRSSREETRNRNRELTRSATRGLAGIGAIAGFMDALEAFDIL